MISVIVPVYNSRDTLARCVKSLQAQTLADLEIILVDDGSSDGSGMLCNGFSREDARIRVIHKANGGVSSARNAGIEAAKGRYLMFMDSDDYAEPEMAEAMLSGIGEDDIAICGFHHHYQGRDVVRIPDVPGQSGEENFLALYGQGFLNMPWNKLYKRELAGRFDESLSLGEDLLFQLLQLFFLDDMGKLQPKFQHPLPPVQHKAGQPPIAKLLQHIRREGQFLKLFPKCYIHRYHLTAFRFLPSAHPPILFLALCAKFRLF